MNQATHRRSVRRVAVVGRFGPPTVLSQTGGSKTRPQPPNFAMISSLDAESRHEDTHRRGVRSKLNFRHFTETLELESGSPDNAESGSGRSLWSTKRCPDAPLLVT